MTLGILGVGDIGTHGKTISIILYSIQSVLSLLNVAHTESHDCNTFFVQTVAKAVKIFGMKVCGVVNRDLAAHQRSPHIDSYV